MKPNFHEEKEKETNITRPFQQPPKKDDELRINDSINSPEVRLINAKGENVGVVPLKEALKQAEDAGLDLVEIATNVNPPVCKIIDYGKYRYELQKKKAEARKNQKVITIKEIKIRPTTDENDYQVKLRHMTRFLGHGDKVKVSLRFRGREIAHRDVGMEVLERIIADLKPIAKVESPPKMEGRQMMMVLIPLKSS